MVGWVDGDKPTAALLNDRMVPVNMIFMWHGTIASIPPGWFICDGNNGTPNLLANQVRGVPTAATNPGSTGGATTHTHTGHSGVLLNEGTGTQLNYAIDGAHDSPSNDPARYDIAYIMAPGKTWVLNDILTQASLDDVSVPSGVIGIWNGTIASIPSGWVLCDGNNGTPNLLARFVKGVATAATNPGTTGGAATHNHATHSNPLRNRNGGADAAMTGAASIHVATNQEPPFYAVAFIMKVATTTWPTLGSISTVLLNDAGVPSGLIGIWHGTIASIPPNWNICDGNGGTPNLLAKHIKGVATGSTNPGATGGAATHNHSAHSIGIFNPGAETQFNFLTDGSHSSASGLPAYYEVAFLQRG